MLPASVLTAKAWAAPAARLARATRATDAILASASPRNPSEAILLVAWRAKAIGRSSFSMPEPLSPTRICLMPPSASATLISVAPASRLFSRSSFSTEAGRSTTSPAAIWLMRASGSGRMAGTFAIICDAVECRGGAPVFRLGSAGSSRPPSCDTARATRRLGLPAALRHYFLRDRPGRDALSSRRLLAFHRRGPCGRRRHRRAPARAAAGRRGGARQHRQLLDRPLHRPESLPLGAIAVLQSKGARPRARVLREARREDHRDHPFRAHPEDFRPVRRRHRAHDLLELHRLQPRRRACMGAVALVRGLLVRQRAHREAEPHVGHRRNRRALGAPARVRVYQGAAEEATNPRQADWAMSEPSRAASEMAAHLFR